jgi:hypothetical protein
MFNIFTSTKTAESDESGEILEDSQESSEESQDPQEVPKLLEHLESQESIRKKLYDTKWFPFKLYNNYLENYYDEIIYKANRLYTNPISVMHHEEYTRSNFYLKLFMFSSFVFLLTIKK